MKRLKVVLVVTVLLSSCSGLVTKKASQDELVVKTTAGLIKGSNENGIYRYLGVPYAEVKERFVPATDVTPWESVRMATEYGLMAVQGSISGLGGGNDQSGTDNNCQNLNIWTPGVNDAKKRPVMVWLHGGGFSTGTANESGYDGENLSREGDVVVVGVNHRLNTFGFLDLSKYGEKYRYSANVGIMDIIDALEWIRNNIETFGGDQDNITVFGQSGGGAKVLALMATPYAKGLFHKGIVQSGATETMGVVFNSKEASARLTENILSLLNISSENIEDIQNISVDDLQKAASVALSQTGEELKLPAALGGGYSMDWEPVVDGDFILANPVTDDSFAETGKDIPLMIGSNLNEWSGYFKVDPITPTEELTEALRSAYPNKPDLKAEEVDTTTIRLPLLKIMSHKASQGGAPVYAYVFTYGNSYHGAEIPYVFNNLGDGATDDEKNLAFKVSQAWINFARNGVPSADGLPEWKPYTNAKGATMLLDTESKLVYHHDRKLMSILFPDYVYLVNSDNSVVSNAADLPFPLGKKIGSPSFIGDVYIEPMIITDEIYNFPATNHITFAPSARSSWHNHSGMALLVTGGVGYYQEEGKSAKILRKGDVVNIPEGVRHWHGATPNSWFSQIVIYDSAYSTGDETQEVPVLEEEYENLETEEGAKRDTSSNNKLMFKKADEASVFDTFNGPIYVSDVLDEDNAALAPGVHYVVFEKGVINAWHTHEGGQILIATDGIGYHQIEGEEVQVLHPGDTAMCPPNVKHWHGGSADSTFAHLAVNTNPEKSGLWWFDRITDEEYSEISQRAKSGF